jgi:hypothetical protein
MIPWPGSAWYTHVEFEAGRPYESIELGAGPFLLGTSHGYRDAFAKSEHNH